MVSIEDATAACIIYGSPFTDLVSLLNVSRFGDTKFSVKNYTTPGAFFTLRYQIFEKKQKVKKGIFDLFFCLFYTFYFFGSIVLKPF